MNTIKKEVFILGTRPEIIKMAPVIKQFPKDEILVVHTGQHTELAKQAYEVFEIIPDIELELDLSCDLTDKLTTIINQLTSIFTHHEGIETVWVHGDTLSAFAGALVAFHKGIKIAHVEAGLRTHDLQNPFPEEAYRQMIDRIATYLFAPTLTAINNLYNEELMPSGAWLLTNGTGNTVVDALEIVKPKLTNGCEHAKFVLVTMHRRESFGEHMREAFEAIKEISKEIDIVFPAHPNPVIRKMLDEVGIKYIEPVDYLTFLELLNSCEYVITDSGGTQEEAPSFEKRTVVLRTVTERSEAVDAGISVIISEFKKETILQIIEDFVHRPMLGKFTKNPFGNGHAAEYIKYIYDREKSK